MRDYLSARYDAAVKAVAQLKGSSDKRVACQASFIVGASRLRAGDDAEARKELFWTLGKCYNTTLPIKGDAVRLRALAAGLIAERAAIAGRLGDIDELERVMKLDLPSDRMNVYGASGTTVEGSVKVRDYLDLQRARILVAKGQVPDAAPLLDRLDWSTGKVPWKGAVVALRDAVADLRKAAGL